MVTDSGNMGTVGIWGSITNGGKTINIDRAGYMTHSASGNHSGISNITITSIIGLK